MPNERRTSFIELNRRFRRIQSKQNPEEAAVESYARVFGLSTDTFSWDDLLQKHRVIILGEAGSGKSLEMEQRVHVLKMQATPAFFVRLDQLVGSAFSELLDVDDQARFDRWLEGDETAYFFLDSV